MKITTDRIIGIIALFVGVGAFYYGFKANKQNKEIIKHTQALKEKLNLN